MTRGPDEGSGSCPLPLARHREVLLGHGNGGVLMAQLIEQVFMPAFTNPVLDRQDDQALVEVEGARLAFTTDSFVVTPIFFPGGDIGRLAIHGTVNDLAMGGARPLFISAAFIIEEGLAIEELSRVVASMKDAAREANVQIVTGDTKVVGKGSGDKLFITTSGIGSVPADLAISSDRARPGDAVVVSGTIGDHGVAIMSCRRDLGLEGAFASDTAPLTGLVDAMLGVTRDLHVLRDPTRGGVAATLSEIAQRSRIGVQIDEESIPVRPEVAGACELLGLDPLAVANEGKLIAFVPGEHAAAIVDALRAHPLGRDAARIGTVTAEHPGVVVVRTLIGGRRVLRRPYGENLPRIC